METQNRTRKPNWRTALISLVKPTRTVYRQTTKWVLWKTWSELEKQGIKPLRYELDGATNFVYIVYRERV